MTYQYIPFMAKIIRAQRAKKAQIRSVPKKTAKAKAKVKVKPAAKSARPAKKPKPSKAKVSEPKVSKPWTPEQVREVMVRWHEHHAGVFATPWDEALRLLDDCIAGTVRNIETGTNRSTSPPISKPLNPLSLTPMTVKGFPFSRIVCPTMSGRLPSRSTQNPWLMTATGDPPRPPALEHPLHGRNRD